jgi:hypothetical protein
MTSNKRKYGDLSQKQSNTIDDAMMDSVFAAFTARKTGSLPLSEVVEIQPENESKQVSEHVEQVNKLATIEEVNLPPSPQTNFPPLPQTSHRSGDRHSKSKVTVTFRISLETDELITKTSAACALSKQAFLELAIHHLAEQLTSQSGGNGVSKLAHDDRRINFWKTDNIIIGIYEGYTKNFWKPADDREAQQFNAKDIRCVEVGILNTLLRTKARKINSFAYFIPEIEEMYAVKLPDEVVDVMLKRRREQLQQVRKQGM